MDNDRPMTPPGMGPKQTEPQPPKSDTSFTRREMVLAGVGGVLVVVLAVLLIVFMITAGRGYTEIIDSHTETYKVTQEIARIGVPGGGERSLVFYVSGETMACALLERGATGYSVVDVGGGLALAQSGKDGIWMPFALAGNKQEYFLVGMVYDDAVQAVLVDGQPATLVDDGLYRCWYFRGEGNMTINSESVEFRK